MVRKRILGIVIVVALVALAGCTTGDSSQSPMPNSTVTDEPTQTAEKSVSTQHETTKNSDKAKQDRNATVNQAFIVTTDGSPAMVVNISISDYTKVIVEGPYGRVIGETTASPNATYHAFYLSPEPGTYRVKLRRASTTIASKSVTYEGASPVLKSVTPYWEGNTLTRVEATLTNIGDLPLKLSSLSASVRGKIISDQTSIWLSPNETTTISVSPGYSETLAIKDPGTIIGEVTIKTSASSVSQSFSRTFSGANLIVRNVTQMWEGTDLNSVSVSVANTGDLTAITNVSIQSGGSILSYEPHISLVPGESTTITLSSWGYLYNAESSGKHTFRIVATSSNSQAATSISHSLPSAKIDLVSINPVWNSGQLKAIHATVRNTGAFDANVMISTFINGDRYRNLEKLIFANTKETVTFSPSIGPIMTISRGGKYTTTVRINHQNNTESLQKTHTVPDPELSLANTTISTLDIFDDSTVELSSVNALVVNSGKVAVNYDKIVVSVGNSNVTTSPYVTTLPPETAREYTIYTDMKILTGNYELTLAFKNDGYTVETISTTISVNSEN